MSEKIIYQNMYSKYTLKIIPKDNTPKSKGQVKTYEVYSNQDNGATYYVREAGVNDNGLKQYYLIQPFNGMADNQVDELVLQELKEFLELEFAGIKTEEEIMQEAAEKSRENVDLSDLA